MTRRENTNNLDQYFVLDIRHTIYGSIIGMSLCGFSHNKLKKYVFFSCVYVNLIKYNKHRQNFKISFLIENSSLNP
jgi:hypothetical protein